MLIPDQLPFPHGVQTTHEPCRRHAALLTREQLHFMC